MGNYLNSKSPEKPEKPEFEQIQEIISKIQIYLNNYENEVKDLCKTNNELVNEIRNFQLNYSQAEGLNRFSIPVIGQISSGKSTLLNIILNLKDSLQVQSNTTTRFVSIIRHNKDLKDKNPKIYTVKFIERANLKNQTKEIKKCYNFEKNEFIDEDIKLVIKKRNKELAGKNLLNKPENYFYIIENYIPFFSGENEKYADYFEFLDIPGLNENSENLYEDNIYYKKILPLIINNIRVSLFIFDIQNYKNATNSTELYKKYLKMLNSGISDYFDNKKIINDIERKSIYILNKTDLKKDDLQKEKENFIKYLEFNLNVNIEDKEILLLSLRDINLERLKFENFKSYLNYVIKAPKIKTSFNKNLQEIMQKDFLKNIIIPDEIDNDEEEVDEPFLKELEKKLNNNGFLEPLTKKQYDFFEKIFNSNKLVKKVDNKDYEQLIKTVLKSIDSVFKSFIDIKSIENLVKVFDDYFVKEQEPIDKNLNKPKIDPENILKDKNSHKSIQTLGTIFQDLKALEPEHDFIKNMFNNYENTVKYIYKDYKYRILFLGARASGKSSIMNSLIGYNLDLIPLSSNDYFTKIILIIRYSDNIDDIGLYKTNFGIHNDCSQFYFFNKEDLIVKGKENILNKLIELNKEAEKSNEISSFILETPIEFLDEYISDVDKKKQIEFIDLPGINTQNEILENEFLSNLIKYSELFLFVNDKNVVQEENKVIIEKFFNAIIREKKAFNINSILFIVNQIDEIEEINNKEKLKIIMDDFSAEINNLFQGIISSDWNNYLKLSKIADTEEKIICTYFSSKNYKIFKDRINYEKLLESILKDYEGKSIEIILKKVKKNIKYFLENKKDYDNYSQNIINEEILSKFSSIFEKYNYKKEDIQANYEDIKEAIKIFHYLKSKPENIIYNFNFTDFLNKIKDNILKEKIDYINEMILNLIFQLIIDFQRINQNIFQYGVNQKIEFHESLEIKNIYEEFEKTINEVYEKDIKRLNELIKKIINEKKDNEKYYEEFDKIVKELNSFLTENFQIYAEKINKAHRENIEKYSPKKLIKDEYLIDIEFLEDSNYMEHWGNSIKYMTICSSILFFIGEQSFVNIFAGLAFGSIVSIGGGIVLTPVFLIYEGLKYYFKSNAANKKRNEKIKANLEEYLKNLEVVKKRLVNDIYSLYKAKNDDIKNYKISQQNPMKNIYNNSEAFKKIEMKFVKFVSYFNKKGNENNN